MDFRLTALVTVGMIATYVWTGILVAGARRRYGVKAPATMGSDDFNRVWRAHANTLEQFVTMLPALWVFAYYVGDRWAALLGAIWIGGRVLYVLSYSRAAEARGTGFMIGFVAMAAASLGSAVAIVLSFWR